MKPRLPWWLLPLVLAACSSERKPTPHGDSQAAVAEPTPATQRELMVFAAASLRDAFTRLSEDFGRTQDGARVIFNFAGSQELRTQLEHGARADVFASADWKHMRALNEQGLASAATVFVHNEPVVIVPKGSATVKSFQDLPSAERIVIGVPEVPIGSYALAILDKASVQWPDFRKRVEARVVSRELNVRQVLAKIMLGEGDAGIVYRSDAASAANKVDVVAIPAQLNVIAEYPIAVLSQTQQRDLAAAWVDHVRSSAGRAVLASYGFSAPAGGSTTP